jgi:hypothetical protein
VAAQLLAPQEGLNFVSKKDARLLNARSSYKMYFLNFLQYIQFLLSIPAEIHLLLSLCDFVLSITIKIAEVLGQSKPTIFTSQKVHDAI